MKGLIEWLQGKKTYVICVMVLLILILEKVVGIDIPGAEPVNPLEWILAILGMGSLRAAVSKAVHK